MERGTERSGERNAEGAQRRAGEHQGIEERHVGVYNATGPEKELAIGTMLDVCRKASDSQAMRSPVRV